MKKCILSAIIGAMCMFLVLYCIAATGSARKPEVYEHTDFVSDLPQENCFLCGGGSDFPVSTYWGEDNVGILNLNTFELLYLEINRYDDQGQLMEEPAGYVRWDCLQGVDSQTYPWFSAGDYGVACEFKEDDAIDLLIHHCPARYTE